MPALVVREGPAAGQRIPLSGETELGRVGTDLLQEDAEVSRRHALVRSGVGGVEIEDLGSSNGTWVNDERISGTRKLSNGDRVRIGQTTFEVQLEEAGAGTVIAGMPTAGPGVTQVAPTPAAGMTQPGQPSEAQPPAPEPTRAEPPAEEPTRAAPPMQPQPAQAVPPTPPAQGEPTAPMEPARPQTPFQPVPAAQAPTGPQGPAQPALGQPAGAYGQPAGGYAQPSTGYGYGARPGGRPGSVTAAAILLIIAGALTLLWTIYDVVLLVGDFEAAQDFGFLDFLLILLALDVVALAGALLEILGGVKVFSLRGRGIAITGVILVLASWAAGIVYIILEGFTVTSLAWIALVVTVGASVAALVTLLAAGRHFSARTS